MNYKVAIIFILPLVILIPLILLVEAIIPASSYSSSSTPILPGLIAIGGFTFVIRMLAKNKWLNKWLDDHPDDSNDTVNNEEEHIEKVPLESFENEERIKDSLEPNTKSFSEKYWDYIGPINLGVKRIIISFNYLYLVFYITTGFLMAPNYGFWEYYPLNQNFYFIPIGGIVLHSSVLLFIYIILIKIPFYIQWIKSGFNN